MELPDGVSEYRNRDGSRRERGGAPGWRVRVWDHRHNRQVERTVYGGVDDAVALREQLRRDLADTTAPLRPETVRVDQAVVGYLRAYAFRLDGTRRPRSSWRRDEAVLRRFAREFGGNARLDAVTTRQLTSWVAGLRHQRTGAPLDGDTKASYAGVVKRMFKWAAREGLVRANPAADVPMAWGVGSARSALVPDLDEVATLADALDETWPRRGHAPSGGDVAWLLALTGSRWEEMAAVEPSEVDVARRRIVVARTASESGGRRDPREEAKSSAGERHIIIVEQAVPLVARLLELDAARWHRWQAEKAARLAAGDPLPRNAEDRDQRRLVNGPQGGYVSYSTWRRHLASARERCGVDLTAHAFRHIHASLLVAAGADEWELARSLGHRSGTYTRRVYAHLWEDDLSGLQRRASEWLAGRVTALGNSTDVP